MVVNQWFGALLRLQSHTMCHDCLLLPRTSQSFLRLNSLILPSAGVGFTVQVQLEGCSVFVVRYCADYHYVSLIPILHPSKI